MDVVAEIAAAFGARRRLGERALAEPVEKLGRAIIRLAINDENCLFQHAPFNPLRQADALVPSRLSGHRSKTVNVADTIGPAAAAPLAPRAGSWQGGA